MARSRLPIAGQPSLIDGRRARRPVRFARFPFRLSANGRVYEPEQNYQRWLRKACEDLGALYFHVPAGTWAPAGFPDAVIITRAGTLIFAELKTDDGRLRRKQREWLDRLAAVRRIHVGWFKSADKERLYRLLAAPPQEEPDGD